MSDRSAKMTGQTLPPGLRFPTGAVCGSHLIFAGTYLANSYQSFSIWALDLQRMTWTRIEPGTALSKGSWFKGCLWTPTKEPGQSRFVIFGNKQGNLVEDYNRRLLSWEDVVYLDLASFGIYQPPTLKIGLREQELGLAALEEGVGADFEVACDDGRRIACSRKVLEGRWEWFKNQRELLVEKTKKALEAIPPSPADIPLPPTPAGLTETEPRLDPRLTPRTPPRDRPPILKTLHSNPAIRPSRVPLLVPKQPAPCPRRLPQTLKDAHQRRPRRLPRPPAHRKPSHHRTLRHAKRPPRFHRVRHHNKQHNALPHPNPRPPTNTPLPVRKPRIHHPAGSSNHAPKQIQRHHGLGEARAPCPPSSPPPLTTLPNVPHQTL